MWHYRVVIRILCPIITNIIRKKNTKHKYLVITEKNLYKPMHTSSSCFYVAILPLLFMFTLFSYCMWVCPERVITHLLLFLRGLLIQIKGLKIEVVVCYKASWDNVMMWGCIKLGLIMRKLSVIAFLCGDFSWAYYFGVFLEQMPHSDFQEVSESRSLDVCRWSLVMTIKFSHYTITSMVSLWWHMESSCNKNGLITVRAQSVGQKGIKSVSCLWSTVKN